MNERFFEEYLAETRRVAGEIDVAQAEAIVDGLVRLRERGGRLFALGIGGSAANASHAVNDFRKIAGIEAYAPTDNVSELTARANDDGWNSIFAGWLEVSRLGDRDALLVFSVGGGDEANNVSPNLVRAIDYAKSVGAAVYGIVGRDGGHTARRADACVVVPTVHGERVTAHTEAFQAVVWHGIVSHPKLKVHPTKWESLR